MVTLWNRAGFQTVQGPKQAGDAYLAHTKQITKHKAKHIVVADCYTEENLTSHHFVVTELLM